MNLCANETYEKSRPVAPDRLPTVKDSLEDLSEILLKIEFLSIRIAEVVGVEPGDPTENRNPRSMAVELSEDCACAAKSAHRLTEVCSLLGIQL